LQLECLTIHGSIVLVATFLSPSYLQRLKGKSGGIRGNLMGNRDDWY
jgi:hypothetical protein